MFRWFETRIEAFPDEPPARPPETLLAFYLYFIKPVWPAFAVLLVAGFLGSIIEVTLLAFVGSLVDMMKAAETPRDLHGQPLGRSCCGWRSSPWLPGPSSPPAHDLIKNQIIAGPVANRVRWLTHRYVLRQSLGFFQNDFAGRVANKVMQAAPALRDSVVQVIDAIWYAAVQWVGAAVIFAAADWRLLIPLVVWLVAYMGALLFFVPRIKQRSTEAAEARSMLVGRLVDSYTNILTVKLFAHADREDSYARAALDEQMTKWQASLRIQTSMELVLYTLNGFLIVAATGLAIYLWSVNTRDGRRHRRRHRPGAAHRRHVGLDPVGRGRHLREHRRGPGGHGDHQPREPGRRPGGQPAAGRARGRDPLRRRELPLRPLGGARPRRSAAASSTISRC